MDENELINFYERQYGPFIHMAPRDKAIWVRFLIKGGSIYAPFTYDMRVGNGVDMGPNATEVEIKSAYALTTKRIDVVAYKESRVMIIEVKQRAGLGAIGQLTGYKTLFKESVVSGHEVDLWLITDQLQPDMISPLITNGVHYVEVGY